ncbi:MAG: hypothetical protein ONB05_01955, partial [candidate division KSB1 bacterium]|nr:hypothetical protein [candidate division KSB1 bacterium]
LVQEVGSDCSPSQRQPEPPWYRSSFYRIETLAGLKPSNPEIEDGELYWDEERLAFSYFASKEKQE